MPRENLRVLAFDPGYDRLGIAVLERAGGKDVLLHSDCVTTARDTPFPERLGEIGEAARAAFTEFKPNIVALERLYFSTNKKTALAVAEVRGILTYVATEANVPIVEFTPPEVKVAVTGHGKSDKAQVAKMVSLLLSPTKRIAYDDEYDAIAIALTCLSRPRRPGA